MILDPIISAAYERERAKPNYNCESFSFEIGYKAALEDMAGESVKCAEKPVRETGDSPAAKSLVEKFAKATGCGVPSEGADLYLHGAISTTKGDMRNPDLWQTSEKNLVCSE